MCRFLAYLGAPIVLDKLLYQPRNSLIRQSYEARERREPLNGDGFGVGWYVPEVAPTPALYRSIRPAWNDMNLRSIAPRTMAQCIFAHVRAASTGDVIETNCHPFAYHDLLFMHNGEIGGFDRLRRPIRERLSDAVYNAVLGQTDSEHFFGLFLDRYLTGDLPAPRGLAAALGDAMGLLEQLREANGISEPSWLNFAVTNGRSLVATRYVWPAAKHPQTLYYSTGSRYECQGGVCRMRHSDPHGQAVLIVSEKLTDRVADWEEVPHNHIVIVSEDLSVQLQPVVLDRPAAAP